nr:SDR family NAD(P)-dependent oxidoreductase [uncultured Allomuricauda sp.]
MKNLNPKEAKRLKQKYPGSVLITGATSGLGLALSETLANAGFDLILCARGKNRLNQLASEWKKSFGISVQVFAADLSQSDGVVDLIDFIEDKEVGILIAAAGFGTSGNFLDISLDDEINMLKVNIDAVLILCHEISKRFKSQGFGGIVLFSSLVAFQGTPYAANYAATKAYVQNLGEALSVELRAHNIDVLTVAPGPVATGFGKRANMKMDGATHVSKTPLPILSALGRSSTVVPGITGKFLTYSLRLLPRKGKVMVLKAVMGGMTKHQRN